MTSESWQVRPAVRADQRRIADLMFSEAHVHRHLDWRPPLAWLGGPDYWVIESGKSLLAAMACPQDPPRIAWVRVFVFASPLGPLEAWSTLCEAARLSLARAGGALLAAIAVKPWFQNVLRESSFTLRQSIVLLEWTSKPVSLRPPPDGLMLRPMQREDLPEVARVDADAFDPLWANSRDILEQALAQSVSASVAERSDRLLGYQISTGNAFGTHLGRLAVRREAQRHGVGEALLSDLMQQMRRQGAWRVTVNTQDDNIASLKLYERMGFARTGEAYPVFACEVQ